MTTNAVVDDRQHAKKRNTTIAMAFAVVTCIVAVILAANALSAIGEGSEDPFGDLGGPPSVQPPPSTPAESGTEAPPPEPAVPFSSPTGNIDCAINSKAARCDIAERDWEPSATPSSCKLTWGQGLVVDEADPRLTCSNTAVPGSKTVLEYGRTVTKGTLTCTSSQAGMRCANTATGKGFSISRKTYTFF